MSGAQGRRAWGRGAAAVLLTLLACAAPIVSAAEDDPSQVDHPLDRMRASLRGSASLKLRGGGEALRPARVRIAFEGPHWNASGDPLMNGRGWSRRAGATSDETEDREGIRLDLIFRDPEPSALRELAAVWVREFLENAGRDVTDLRVRLLQSNTRIELDQSGERDRLSLQHKLRLRVRETAATAPRTATIVLRLDGEPDRPPDPAALSAGGALALAPLSPYGNDDPGAAREGWEQLRVSQAGSGEGSVLVGGRGCGSACFRTLPRGASVNLIALPVPGSRFSGWSGGMVRSAASTTVRLRRSVAIVATFERVEGAPRSDPPAEPPEVPGAPSARSVGISALELTWPAAPGSLARMEILESEAGPLGPFHVRRTVAARDGRVVLGPLPPCRELWYALRATHDESRSQPSPSVSVKLGKQSTLRILDSVLGPFPPAGPRVFEIRCGNASAGEAYLDVDGDGTVSLGAFEEFSRSVPFPRGTVRGLPAAQSADPTGAGAVEQAPGMSAPWTLTPGRGLLPGANGVAWVRFDPWPDRVRPQFVALHLAVDEEGGLRPLAMRAGDLEARVVGGPGNDETGVVLESDHPPDLFDLRGFLPTPERPGLISGRAIGSAFFSARDGGFRAAQIQLDFALPLYLDREAHQSSEPGSPLKGPDQSGVTQPP